MYTTRSCRLIRWPLLATVAALASVVALATPRADAFTQAQRENGAQTYSRQCARCHGEHGEGRDDQYKGLRATELIGPSALSCRPAPFEKIRQGDFRTATDVYEFVSATMPTDQPAVLDADEYWNAVAYLLAANGRSADGTPLDRVSGEQIVLHPDCPDLPAATGARP